jgi:hypothetical protein
MTALAALAAATTLAFNSSDETIDLTWKISAALAAVLASMLGYAYKRAVPMTRAPSGEEGA